jgi:hypothetical protein
VLALCKAARQTSPNKRENGDFGAATRLFVSYLFEDEYGLESNLLMIINSDHINLKNPKVCFTLVHADNLCN